MASGPEAVAYISKQTGWNYNAVRHHANRLRDDREIADDKWPLAGKGGGKAANHVRLIHSISLGIAMAYGDALHGPDAVDAFRVMVPVGTAGRVPNKKIAAAFKLIEGLNLGNALEALVDQLSADPKNCPEFKVVLHKAAEPAEGFADLVFAGNKEALILSYVAPDAVDDSKDKSPAFETSATINFTYFKIAAELWRDTQRHYTGLPSELATDI